MVCAIPDSDSLPDGKDIPILDCGDSIERLESCDRIFVAPAYYALGFTTATNEIRLRRTVIAALRAASSRLPVNVALIVWDGLRSLATQAEIQGRIAASFCTLQLADSDRRSMQDSFVSPLPTTQANCERTPPPHTTGAAVDLSLCDPSGNPLDMGAEFDQFDSAASIGYYERGDEFGEGHHVIRYRRRLLYWAMIGAGFAPYSPEFWHFEYGTQRASAFYGRPTADYGCAVPWENLEGIKCN